MNSRSTIDSITSLLFIESQIEPVDLIFVFGNDWTETMDEVSKLYFNNISETILITGNSAKGGAVDSEAIKFKSKGISLGIPESAIITETQATNTKENMVFSMGLIDEAIGLDKIKKILFVCKTFHTRRVLMTARNFLPPSIEFSFLPMIDERKIEKHNWWTDELATKRVLEEIQRIAKYSLKGDLSIL